MEKQHIYSTLKIKLAEDLKLALKAGDRTRVSAIRLLIAAINNATIARLAELKDADIHALIAKEIKQRQESIEAFKKGNRADLVAQESAEMQILQEYLPQQLSREEIILEAQRVIQDTGAHGIRDKGKVMPTLMADLKGKADGRIVNEVVTNILSSQI